jgi:2-keto-4-pentenoate hydratase/2-oxohepta-3-ene-1,7-dioic acid hydratase in catechol pathway
VRFVVFEHELGPRLGVLAPDGCDRVVDLTQLAALLGEAEAPANLIELIEAGEPGLDTVRRLLENVDDNEAVRPLGEHTLLSPFAPRPREVLCIGRNYAEHAAEAARAQHTEVGPPTIFTKAATTVAGPYDELPFDFSISSKLDWEVELGVVIGKPGANVAGKDALDHVFGYCVVNDITARDIQKDWGGQWFKGKSFDHSCPTGPFVVTADEVDDPQRLTLSLKVNGVEKQRGETKDMIRPVRDVIAWLSVGMTLPAGTLIATGTPDGVGFARTPPEFLRAGDIVEAEVEGLGTLRNRIVPAA